MAVTLAIPKVSTLVTCDPSWQWIMERKLEQRCQQLQ